MGDDERKTGHGPPGDELPDQPVVETYDAYGDDLYRYAVMLLADPHDAEDVIQQVFLKLMARGAASVRTPGAYLRTAVRNECYRVIRRRRSSLEATEIAGNEPFLEHSEQSAQEPVPDELAQLEIALRSLPPTQREVIHLRIFERRTFREIAEATGASLNTAASRYRYAVEKLRSLLARREEE